MMRVRYRAYPAALAHGYRAMTPSIVSSSKVAMSELKQLQFVDSSARGVLQYAEGAYGKARGLVPGFLMTPVEKAEGLVAPYYGKAQTLAHDVLVNIDGKVRGLLPCPLPRSLRRYSPRARLPLGRA